MLAIADEPPQPPLNAKSPAVSGVAPTERFASVAAIPNLRAYSHAGVHASFADIPAGAAPP
jgi:hypothetical protein